MLAFSSFTFASSPSAPLALDAHVAIDSFHHVVGQPIHLQFIRLSRRGRRRRLVGRRRLADCELRMRCRRNS
jgi:hypothetical protein